METGVLDTTLLDKNTVTDLVFKLSFNSPGKCNILGVEYSIKAMFPDKEPTDHEIRGNIQEQQSQGIFIMLWCEGADAVIWQDPRILHVSNIGIKNKKMLVKSL